MNEDEPKWLSVDEVIRINQATVQKHGGLSGLSEQGRGKLEGGLSRPQSLYAYEDCRDIHELAASYAEGVARSHAFADGNKRTAFLTADLFLELNGQRLELEQTQEQIEYFEKFAEGLVSREQMAQTYRDHCRPIESENQQPEE